MRRTDIDIEKIQHAAERVVDHHVDSRITPPLLFRSELQFGHHVILAAGNIRNFGNGLPERPRGVDSYGRRNGNPDRPSVPRSPVSPKPLLLLLRLYGPPPGSVQSPTLLSAAA
jgi:hypothetical protein